MPCRAVPSQCGVGRGQSPAPPRLTRANVPAPPTPDGNGQRSARRELTPPRRLSARAQCVAQGGLVDGRLRPTAATMAAADRVRGVGAPPVRGGS